MTISTEVSFKEYIDILKKRESVAIKKLSFWREFFIVLICGGMGFWLPYFMEWDTSIIAPKSVLTFGTATLSMIFDVRFFSKELESERLSEINKFIIFIGIFISLFFLIQSVKTENDLWTISSLLLILLLWHHNHINNSKYDIVSSNNPIGGLV